MITPQHLADIIASHLPHNPTPDQQTAMNEMSRFLLGGETNAIFILKGFAGTGKTSVISALLGAMADFNAPVVLLAPTGRAAKVLSTYSSHPAFTIHKWIYRQKIAGKMSSHFSQRNNMYGNALFIVDEASMIADSSTEEGFGSGDLFSDLLNFVYGMPGNHILFAGDNAQLPPVGLQYSPALDENRLRAMGFSVYSAMLKTVVRQSLDSGILFNATHLRSILGDQRYFGIFPDLKTDGFPDIVKITSETLIEDIADAYDQYGEDETIIITRSNKRATQFNYGVRNTVLDRESDIGGGDLVMVVKNNYYWSKDVEGLDFIANGEIARIKRVRRHTELYGFHFAEVELTLIDYDIDIEAKVILDALRTESPALTREQNERLYKAVEEDYMDIPTKRDRHKKIMEDPYYNALQIKFAYSVTCHKAQGGQWSAVFLDNGYLTLDMIDTDYYRWLYTAITRATKKVYLLNWRAAGQGL